MNLRSRRVIALAAVFLGLALAGGGAALAVGKSSSKAGGSTSTQSGTSTTPSTTKHCPGGGPGRGFGFAFPALPPSVDAAASYLGLTSQQLMSKLMSGQSLADVAKAQGKSVAGLEDTIVNSVSDRLQKAVDAGRITAQQRDQILGQVRAHVDDLVNRAPPHFRGGMRPGFGGPPPMWGGPDHDQWPAPGHDQWHNGPPSGGSSGNSDYAPPAAGSWA